MSVLGEISLLVLTVQITVEFLLWVFLMVMENAITINVCLKYKAIHVYITERFTLCFKVLTLTKTHKMRSKYFLQTTTIIYYLTLI